MDESTWTVSIRFIIYLFLFLDSSIVSWLPVNSNLKCLQFTGTLACLVFGISFRNCLKIKVSIFNFSIFYFTFHMHVHALKKQYTVLRIIKLNLFPVPVRLHSGSGKLIFRRYFIFRYFKNVVHSLEPGETPSYSASYQAPKQAQRS